MKRRARRSVLWIAASLAILATLIFDFSPDTPDLGQPSAADSAAAIATLRRIRENTGTTAPAEIFLTNEEAQQTLRLAGRAAGFPRTAAVLEPEGITGKASVRLPLGLWLNIAASMDTSETGFPRVTGRVGRLPIPAFVMRALIDAYLGRLRRDGVFVPDLDAVVHGMEVVSNGVRARLQLPPESALFGVVNRDPAPRVERALVIAEYCRLALLQRERPAADLAGLFRGAFNIDEKGADASATNRARLVAVAMIVVSRDAGSLAGVSEAALSKCPAPAMPVNLQGRVDLAQHFSLSAAIAVSVNQAFSRRLGIWKELADSSPGGTGFSFVDLSADRAGLLLAKRLTSPETAIATAKRMQTIGQEELLPITALAFSEGLSEEQFRARYVSPESKAYNDMIARIDAVLGKAY